MPALAALSLLAGCSPAASPAADQIPSPAVRGSAASGGPHLGEEGLVSESPSTPSTSLAVDQPEPSGDSQTSEAVGVVSAPPAAPDTIAPPPVSLTTSPPSPGPVESRAAGDLAAILACIRQWESGGDYTAVSPDGLYRGGYQAAEGTWGGYGGYRWADEAPAALQDAWAAELVALEGLSPWPTPAVRCAA